MNFPNAKELKKLAAACRKAGIKHYKCGDVEFTLTDEAPSSNYKKSKAKSKTEPTSEDSSFESDSLTEEQLLMWSAPDQIQEEKASDQ